MTQEIEFEERELTTAELTQQLADVTQKLFELNTQMRDEARARIQRNTAAMQARIGEAMRHGERQRQAEADEANKAAAALRGQIKTDTALIDTLEAERARIANSQHADQLSIVTTLNVRREQEVDAEFKAAAQAFGDVMSGDIRIAAARYLSAFKARHPLGRAPELPAMIVAYQSI